MRLSVVAELVGITHTRLFLAQSCFLSLSYPHHSLSRHTRENTNTHLDSDGAVDDERAVAVAELGGPDGDGDTGGIVPLGESAVHRAVGSAAEDGDDGDLDVVVEIARVAVGDEQPVLCGWVGVCVWAG